MTRSAVIFAVAALAATPALAGTYSAAPVAAPSAAKIIGKDISWVRDGGIYRGSTEASRPLVICQDLVKHAGRLESFSANGQRLSAAELDKCNAKAAGGQAALARAN